jgi:hypothetical protein
MVAGCFLLLFGLPFFLAGVALATSPLWGPMSDSETGESAPLIVIIPFGLIFAAVGLGIFYSALVAMGLIRTRAMKEAERLETLHPGEPWMRNPEWAVGRLVSQNKSAMHFMWFFALVWNAISMPVLFFVPHEILEKENYPAIIALIFPCVGVGLLYAAVRSTLQYRKFGNSIFEMSLLPGVPGGRLQGIVVTNKEVAPPKGFAVSLTCVNLVTTGAGEERSTSEHVRWRDEKVASVDLLPSDLTRTGVPIDFILPADVNPTDEENSDNRWIWRLDVHAEVDGTDFRASFEVPVFRAAPRRLSIAIAPEKIELAAELPAPPAAREIHAARVRDLDDGALEVYFPPFRHPGVAIFTGLGALAFLAGFIALIRYAPLPGVIIGGFVTGLFSLILGLTALHHFFATVRVRVDNDAVTVTSNLLFYGRARCIPLGEVEKTVAEVSSQQSRSPIYALMIRRSQALPIAAGDHIPSKAEADAIAERIMKAVHHRRGDGFHGCAE